MHGQSGSIRRDNRAGLAKLRHARQQVSLDLQIFRDDFDDPVGFRTARQIIIKISDSDAIRKRRRKKRRGLRFFARRPNPRGQFCSRIRRRVRRHALAAQCPAKRRSPAFAKCAAMRAPIVPAPNTTAFSIRRFMGSLFQFPRNLAKCGRTGYKTSIPRSNKRTQRCNGTRL